MIRKLLLLTLGSVMTVSVNAGVLTPEEALQRVKTGMQKASYNKLTGATQLVYTGKTPSDEVATYVFAPYGGKGYIILSAEDKVLPVLGYSYDRQFDSNCIPPQLEWWLQEYGREIEYARKSGIASVNQYDAPADWIAIEPMIKTKWNQDAPYYNLCPEKNEKHCYTGCVATAMAQVMNYFQYPDRGEGKASYTCAGIGNISLDLEEKPFEWHNMRDTYETGNYTEEEGEAVAYLMQACGYSIKTTYRTDGSGAQSINVPVALANNFKYDRNVRYARRMLYSSSEWNALLYENLKNVGPIIYNGSSTLGGHSFVCDGFDGNGYFHFNWGWSGQGDGYFLLSALNPSIQGIGGFAGGFNSNQDAILGIQRPTGEPIEPEDFRIVQYGALHANLKGDKIGMIFTDWNPVGYAVLGTEKFRCNIGTIIEPIDATSGETRYVNLTNNKVVSLIPTSFYQVNEQLPLTIQFPEETPNGKYKVTLATKVVNEENAEWLPSVAPYGFPNYFYVTKSDDGINIENVEIPQMRIESLVLKSECYYGYLMQFGIKIYNPTDLELTQGLCPVLLKDNEIEFLGDSKLFVLAPGETREEVWNINFTKVGTNPVPSSGKTAEYTLAAYNPDTDKLYGEFGTVVMTRLAEKTSVESLGLTIQNATVNKEDEEIIYCIEDPNKIKVEQLIEVKTGYFAYPLIFRIFSGDTALLNLESEQTFEEIPFIIKGETESVTGIIVFPEAEEGKEYIMKSLYMAGPTPKSLSQIKFKYDTTGIDTIPENRDFFLTVDRNAGIISIEAINGIRDIKVYRADGTETSYDVQSINQDKTRISIKINSTGMIFMKVAEELGKHHSYKVVI